MKHILIIILLSFSVTVNAQILRPGEKPEEKKETPSEEKKTKKKEEKETPKTVVIDGEEYEIVKKKSNESDTLKAKKSIGIQDQFIYANLIPSHVYRTFEPGSYPLTREDEVPGFKLSYMLGLRNKLSKHILLDIGFAYYVNGENYFYEDTDLDSSYFKTRNHNTLSIPLKVGFQIPLKDFNLFFQLGGAPSMLINQVEKIEYTVGADQPVTDRIVNKNNLNQFNMTLLGAIGVQYNFSEYWGIQIMPEFRYNLMPSDINVSYEHRAWAVGFHVGLTFGK